MSVQRPLAGIALLLVLVAAMGAGGPLIAFIDRPSALLSLVGAAAAWWMLAGHRIGGLLGTLRRPTATQSELELALVTARQSRRAVWLAGMVGPGIGLIQILHFLDDPAALGPALAVCLLTPLYSLLLDLFVSSPLIATVAARRATVASTEVPSRSASGRQSTRRSVSPSPMQKSL